jgi:hypothetical protein
MSWWDREARPQRGVQIDVEWIGYRHSTPWGLIRLSQWRCKRDAKGRKKWACGGAYTNGNCFCFNRLWGWNQSLACTIRPEKAIGGRKGKYMPKLVPQTPEAGGSFDETPPKLATAKPLITLSILELNIDASVWLPF